MKKLPALVSLEIRRGMFLFLLLVVTAVFFGLITDFLMATFWAAIFAILFQDTFGWLSKRFNGRRSLAAFVTCLLILFAVVIPIGLLSIAVVDQSKALYDNIETKSIDTAEIIHSVGDQIPALEKLADRFGVDMDDIYKKVQDVITTGVSLIGKSMWKYTQGAVGLIIDFFLMLYLMFYFVRDGTTIIQRIRETLPLGNTIEDTLFLKFSQVARATLKGTVIVAACQGLIGGILFAVLGIKASILWGVLMGLLSLLPVGGSGIVWVPAAIIMFVNGHVTDGIIIIIVGALGIGLIDNLLRPILVGRETKMPDYLVLLATLGGLAWFGLSGFIIGPVIAALFITCWEISGELFGGKA